MPLLSPVLGSLYQIWQLIQYSYNPVPKSEMLKVAPTRKTVKGPDPELTRIAEEYAKENGIEYNRQSEFVKVNEALAKDIA